MGFVQKKICKDLSSKFTFCAIYLRFSITLFYLRQRTNTNFAFTKNINKKKKSFKFQAQHFAIEEAISAFVAEVWNREHK